MHAGNVLDVVALILFVLAAALDSRCGWIGLACWALERLV